MSGQLFPGQKFNLSKWIRKRCNFGRRTLSPQPTDLWRRVGRHALTGLLLVLTLGHLACTLSLFVRKTYSRTERIESASLGLPFPTVVVCTLNWLSARRLSSLFEMDASDAVLAYMNEVMGFRSTFTPVDPPFLLSPTGSIGRFNDSYWSIKRRWRQVQTGDSDDTYTDSSFYAQVALTCAEVFTSCSYQNRPFYCCQYAKIVYTDYGRCYQIRSPDTPKIVGELTARQTIPGLDGGLTVTLTVSKREPLLNVSDAALNALHGAAIYLMPSTNEMQNSFVSGLRTGPFLVAADTTAFMRLRYLEQQQLSCRSNSTTAVAMGSLASCISGCKTNASMSILGCVKLAEAGSDVHPDRYCRAEDYYMMFANAAYSSGVVAARVVAPAPTSLSTTVVATTSTTTTATTLNGTENNNNNGNNSTSGHPTTTETPVPDGAWRTYADDYYLYKNALYTNRHAMITDCQNRRCSQPCVRPSFDASMTLLSSAGQFADVTDRNVTVNIYYEKLVYRVHRQVRSMNIVDLIALLGGVMALWAGVSVLTVVQTLIRVVQFARLYLTGKTGDQVRTTSSRPTPTMVPKNSIIKRTSTQSEMGKQRQSVGLAED